MHFYGIWFNPCQIILISVPYWSCWLLIVFSHLSWDVPASWFGKWFSIESLNILWDPGFYLNFLFSRPPLILLASLLLDEIGNPEPPSRSWHLGDSSGTSLSHQAVAGVGVQVSQETSAHTTLAGNRQRPLLRALPVVSMDTVGDWLASLLLCGGENPDSKRPDTAPVGLLTTSCGILLFPCGLHWPGVEGVRGRRHHWFFFFEDPFLYFRWMILSNLNNSYVYFRCFFSYSSLRSTDQYIFSFCQTSFNKAQSLHFWLVL